MRRLGLLATFALLVLAGCGGGADKPSSGGAGGKPIVLATILPVYSLALDVVGETSGVELSLLLPPNSGCPHDYALSPGDIRKLVAARLVLANGAGLEEFLLDKPLRKARPDLKVIYLSEGLQLISGAAGAAAETKGAHHHAEEDNGHTFASPRNAAHMTKLIGEALSGIDPANAEAYRRNAAASAAQLDALADELAAAAKGFPNRKIVAIHDVLAYFARDAGLELIAVIEEDPGQAPGLGELDKLVQKTKREKPAAIFYEPQYSADPAKTLGRETGVPVFELDPFASGEAKRGAYLAAMRRNLTTLKTSLGPKAP